METYSFLRQLADSWFLLAMFVFFIGVVIFAFRPGSTKVYDDVADIPFRHEDKPAPDGGRPEEA
ncbi:cbb3-type cytochrome c oxidase subunit 3 [Lutimaribacter sp. EGI FJ00015]|uniref:Cbb3-type cytochrome c oxidase subunit 3 n=1 Tax=Lutimaribacter degradans TaxID=2945989 RepID=A0ACC5ZXW5_9RHOB|nr:cbb3-type cytochrome c oxidase subunit 3 [Lutimaribacter sp. EGI FJ00013]MCM2562758.1 cbb3-type cytochrome c oxidase subunit 3 [Lutimaribacter sp. EGI FJ00013]MCO0613915.1 cbb3-type cytochrome c oxidase subunit 3 [Lutimaribacter sp. EGI FJ00015]MCO0636887.1 cbb3-type cytochrome c oxidase subunit 3 [Lutimaribacter sp. EGI FJ00014]